MKTNPASTGHSDHGQYALRREGGSWQLTFEGRQAGFKHELGALYVAYLLLSPPREPIHAVALALNARGKLGQPPSPAEAEEQRVMGLEDMATIRALWRRQRELERVLQDRLEIEPVKAEAQAELEEITEHLRRSPWMSRHGAERCARAVAAAIRHFYAGLAAAVDAEGNPHPVLRLFAAHLYRHLLLPSGLGCGPTRAGAWAPVDCFIYVPPPGVVWAGPTTPPPSAGATRSISNVQCPMSDVRHSGTNRPAAVEYLSSLLCALLAFALLATGCAGPRPLKGGKAVTTRKPAGVIEQTLIQGENPSQPTTQAQETVKVRTYTVPAGSRLEQSPLSAAASSAAADIQHSTFNLQPCAKPSALNSPPSSRFNASTLQRFNVSPSAFVLSSPMPVTEREESRTRTELGAAQKDTARELGAKLASLKGVVWVGVGLFIFGLASLVWPPLKAVIASVTTSVALMLGGVALMVLPSLIVGNELLILGGVGLAVGAWFLAHRHGQLRGMVAANATQP